MALVDNMRLYDIAARHQAYVEGVKVQYSREFNYVLKELAEELRVILSRVKYKTLDALTKAELNKLVSALRESQIRVYSAYTERLVKQLRDFMSVDLEVTRRIYASARLDLEDISDEDAVTEMEDAKNEFGLFALFGIAAVTRESTRLWSAIHNAPIPANGLYLLPFLKTFTNSAQAGVENLIRKAWANGWTLEETLSALAGTAAVQGTGSQIQRIRVQGAAVIETSVQHVASMVNAGVLSSMFEWYVWLSVMDDRTTDICRSRNKTKYRFGKGPLPPAHVRCRSHIAPIVGNSGDILAESFYTWISRQPENVQADLLGSEIAEKVRTGKIKAKDLPKYDSDKPLTLSEFKRKVLEILSR